MDDHEEAAPINAVLNSGRTVPCNSCDCGSCGNEWFVPGYSLEWAPRYCPYCGIKFNRRTVDGEPAPWNPAPCDSDENSRP